MHRRGHRIVEIEKIARADHPVAIEQARVLRQFGQALAFEGLQEIAGVQQAEALRERLGARLQVLRRAHGSGRLDERGGTVAFMERGNARSA